MWPIVLSAIALVLVFEGVLPFLSPRLWRDIMLRLVQRNDRQVRVMGLTSMVIGVAIMVLVHTWIY
jgi:uncharacterized protein YjeT (DUF2065 family)